MVGLSIISSLLFALLNAITIWLVGSLITSIMSPNSTTESKDTSFFSNFQDLLMPTSPSEDPLGCPMDTLHYACSNISTKKYFLLYK